MIKTLEGVGISREIFGKKLLQVYIEPVVVKDYVFGKGEEKTFEIINFIFEGGIKLELESQSYIKFHYRIMPIKSREEKMAKTLEEVERVRKTASRLEKLGVPRKTADRIRQWATKEEKRIRDEAHGW